MKIKEIKPRIYLVDFETRQELLKTFIRFQEYYESPEFKDKVFTVDEYAKWYQKETGKDTFTYFDDWSGCNVPSYVFEKFREGLFNPLREREKKLLEILPNDGQNYYVIGAFNGGRKDVVAHEIMHGLFYSIPDYKKEVLNLLDQYKNETEDVKKHILKKGYHEAVLLDEVHAYVGASYEHLTEKGVPYPVELKDKLQEVVKKYNN